MLSSDAHIPIINIRLMLNALVGTPHHLVSKGVKK